jgi:basic amino acid/polyamine antiporter, APA family
VRVAPLLLDISAYYVRYYGRAVWLSGGALWPNFMSASNPGPMFMMAVAILTAFGVAYIAYRGVSGATSVNIAINVIQISALLIFSVMALSYGMNHPRGSVALNYDA